MKSAFAVLSIILFSQVIAMAQAPTAEPQVVSLWPNGAPGFENRRNEPEQAKDWWVRNIHNPSITVFLPPPEKATGAAVVIAPGGGFRELVFNGEGRDAALFLNSVGVAAFALKYRLPNEADSPYTVETHVRQDAYRALRLVRSRAKEWNIDPTRVGILGFSAGGAVASLVAYTPGDGDPKAADPIDRLNGRPDFQMLVYPGDGGPDVIPADAPPAFLVVANDDDYGCDKVSFELLRKYREAKLPIEAHFYAHGKHAFNMGNRSDLITIRSWPQRMADWLQDNYARPATPVAAKP
jgi:acetyl esterase/lipase